MKETQAEWWRGCVIYQIYPRSYQDSNGDGIGDLKGITQRLPHIAKLGADAIWISPFFKSPMKDFGYDVADYCNVDPIFGTLDDAKTMLQTAHALGLKVMVDMVWSHTSDQHDWFKQSRSNKDNDKHDWYVWADPKPDGTPPNNWLSYFGGPAWTWDARREQYYLHHFLKEQPSLNLWNPAVEDAVQQTAKFWLDLGVDGFRLDVAHAYLYDRQLRDNPPKLDSDPWPTDIPPSNPMARQRRVHQMCVPENITFIERLRAYVNQWPERCLLGEAGGDDSEGMAVSYVQTGKRFHQAYSFGLVGSQMRADTIRKAVNGIESRIEDGWICWATSNHDFKRAVSRYPAAAQHHDAAAKLNMALGLTLRGSYCLYQGEELGLPQAELTFDQLRDPYDIMLYPEHVGRDGCRTPMPWDSTAPHAGFTAANAQAWLPVTNPHIALAVDTQTHNPDSPMACYQKFLQLRRTTPALRLGDFTWSCATDPLLGYIRAYDGERILCLFNPSADALSADILPADYDVLMENAVARSGKTISFSPFGFAVLRILNAE